MPHLQTASLGVWVGAGSRDEARRRARHFASARAHGLQGHQAAQRARRSPRRSRRSAAISMPRPASKRPAISRACSRPTCRWRSTCWPTSCRDPAFDAGRAAARAERDRAGDRRGRGRARRPGVRPLAGDGLSQAAGRPLHPRHAGDGALVHAGAAARLSRAQLPRARHGGGRRRRGRAPARSSAEVERRFAGFDGPAAPPPEPAQLRRRHAGRAARSRAGAHRARAQGLPVRDEALYSLQVFTSVLGGGMSSRLFQEVREKRGLCYSIHAFHMPYADTGLFGLYAGTDESRRARADARRHRRDRQRDRDAQRGRGRTAPRRR